MKGGFIIKLKNILFVIPVIAVILLLSFIPAFAEEPFVITPPVATTVSSIQYKTVEQIITVNGVTYIFSSISDDRHTAFYSSSNGLGYALFEPDTIFQLPEEPTTVVFESTTVISEPVATSVYIPVTGGNDTTEKLIYKQYSDDLTNTLFYNLDGTYYVVDLGETGFTDEFSGSSTNWGTRNDCVVYLYNSDTSTYELYSNSSTWKSGSNPFSPEWVTPLFVYNDVSRNGFNFVANFSYPIGFDSLSSTSLSDVMSGIKSLFPLIVPIVVSFFALRKGWSFLKGEIATA